MSDDGFMLVLLALLLSPLLLIIIFAFTEDDGEDLQCSARERVVVIDDVEVCAKVEPITVEVAG